MMENNLKILDEKIRQNANKELVRLTEPLKFRVSGKRYTMFYRGSISVSDKPFTQDDVINIKRSVDKYISEYIDSFTHPIYREVFGL